MRFYINGFRVPRSIFEQVSDTLLEITVDDVHEVTSGIKIIDEYTEYLQNFPFASMNSSKRFDENFRKACFIFNFFDDEMLK